MTRIRSTKFLVPAAFEVNSQFRKMEMKKEKEFTLDGVRRRWTGEAFLAHLADHGDVLRLVTQVVHRCSTRLHRRVLEAQGVCLVIARDREWAVLQMCAQGKRQGVGQTQYAGVRACRRAAAHGRSWTGGPSASPSWRGACRPWRGPCRPWRFSCRPCPVAEAVEEEAWQDLPYVANSPRSRPNIFLNVMKYCFDIYNSRWGRILQIHKPNFSPEM